jgi:hypothetical protein
MDPAPSKIVIELEPGAVPICGQVCPDGGAAVAFTGWMGLFAVLRAAAAERPTNTEDLG